jgi:Uncharacterized conserved protein
MARPSTKPDLIQAANDQFEKMWERIDSMTDEEQGKEFHFGDAPNRTEAHWGRDKNLRDVLVHLYEWHQLLLNWVGSNLTGKAAPFLPAPYNWKTYGTMNMEFWSKHQSTPYAEARKMLVESHKKVLELIEQFSDEELFVKKYFPWVGTTSLGSYCVSATSSHYDWAMKKIKLHIKTP